MCYCLLNQDRAIQFQCKGYIFYQESLIHQCFQKHILGEEVVLEGAKEQVVSHHHGIYSPEEIHMGLNNCTI